MARITLGQVYGIVDFHGTKLSKGRPIGGYLPTKAGEWARIVTLNMPTYEVHRIGRLRPPESYHAAGVFWALLSMAANSPIPGKLVESVNGRYVAQGDARLADLLGLDPAAWTRAAALLQGGTGAGVLEVTAATVEVADHEAAQYEAATQEAALDRPGSLFWTGRNGDSHCADNVTKRGMKRNENETERPPPRSGPAPALDAPGQAPACTPAAGRAVRCDLEQLSSTDLLRTVATEAARKHRHDDSRNAWLRITELALGAKSARDRRDFARLFSEAWNAVDEQRRGVPAGEVRAQRIDAFIVEALAVAHQDHVTNRAAYFLATARAKAKTDF